MRKKFSTTYGVLILLLFFALFFPTKAVFFMRENVVKGLSPIHQGISFLKAGFFFKASNHPFSKAKEKKEIDDLKLENALLTKQLEEVKEYLLSEERFDRQIKKLEEISATEKVSKDFYKRREGEYLEKLSLMAKQIPAKIVYRDPAFWSSYVWINVGKNENEMLGEEVISVDSPVVIGNNIVGVIDYVGKTQSKVALITDASFTTSVRVQRGSLQNKLLLDELAIVKEKLKFAEDLFFSKEEQENTLNIFDDLADNIKLSIGERYLAKGELRGSSKPLWRLRKESLSGVGFNFDFDDVEGEARDLRTGAGKKDQEEVSLVKEGDLLVTTGMDGIFPAGFHAAIVTKVDPLEEGAISYSLEAKAACGDLSEISHVYVLKKVQD